MLKPQISLTRKAWRALSSLSVIRLVNGKTLSFFFLVFASLASADPWQHLNQGDQLAQQFLNQSNQKKKEAGSHPFYSGIPNESKLSDGQLKGNSAKVAQQDSASKMVNESAETRPQFKLDPSNDPLLLGSQKIQKNPLQDIGGEGTHFAEVVQGGKDETLTCEEAGENSQHTCTETVVVTIKQELGPLQSRTLVMDGPTLYHAHQPELLTLPRMRSKHFVGHIRTDQGTLKGFISRKTGIPIERIQSVAASNNGGWVKIRKKRYSFSSYTFTYNYQELLKIPIISHQNTCGALESKIDRGLCSYASRVCTHQGVQTRIIEGVPVTQKCWEETFAYTCEHPSKNNCGTLRARGCVQSSSTCKQKIGNACVVYTQTYQCKGKSQTSYKIAGGDTPFCLDGNCRNQSWEANDEMMASIAQLSLLKEMEGQFANGMIFKGADHRCTKYIISFKDCCGSGKGWGEKVGFRGCSKNEKLLQKKRQERLCHYVGTYCAKKALGKCIKKKSTYCCFNNKLLKAFHEQGRPQINLGWGSPKKPLCRGFTIEEIQRIDFSKLDLREAFEDLMQKFQTGQNKSNAPGMGKHIGERMETIQKGMRPPTERQPPQREEGA